jgi:hypothetical protein
VTDNRIDLETLTAAQKASTSGVAAGERTTRGSTQESLRAAGWSDSERIALTGAYESLSWGNLRTLLAARREIPLGQNDPDGAAAAMRNAWFEPGTAPPETLEIAAPRESTRVLLLGDTGDGSEAQAAVALHLRGRALSHPERSPVAALIIQSDIVYPAGARDEYKTKFADVYDGIRKLAVPIYAVPGNHDWDDGTLAGFMAAFCGRETTPEAVYDARNSALTLLQRLLWWPPFATPLRKQRPAPAPSGAGVVAAPAQTHPYVALDIGGVLYIGIDTGFGTCIDRVQARWLIDTAECPENAEKPKILFTGKPLIVNGVRRPCPFAQDPATGEGPLAGAFGSYGSVDDVVREPRNGFIAALGGDVHNYQRYLAHIERRDDRSFSLPYVVSGGGGVFIGQTYWIPPIAESAEVAGGRVSYREEETVLFPTRSHSFLYWDKLVRQSRLSPPFTASVTLLAVAIATTILAGAVGLLDWIFPLDITDPSLWTVPLLLLVSVAANISARPIAPNARVMAFALAALPGAAICWWMAASRALDLRWVKPDPTWGRYLIAAGLLGGVALLQAADLSPLGRGELRKVRDALTLAAYLALGGAALWLLATSFGRAVSHGWSYSAAVAVVAVAILLFLWLTRLFSRKLSVDTTVRALHAELASGAKTRLTRSIRRARMVGERQKVFSIFETFNDGRLEHKVRKPLSGTAREYLPLYRSFLEIESRHVNREWSVQFTSFAVTGERTSDTGAPSDPGPVVVDRFTVRWAPGGPATFVITP